MGTCTRHEVCVIYDCAPSKVARNKELCFLDNNLRKIEDPILRVTCILNTKKMKVVSEFVH